MLGFNNDAFQRAVSQDVKRSSQLASDVHARHARHPRLDDNFEGTTLRRITDCPRSHPEWDGWRLGLTRLLLALLHPLHLRPALLGSASPLRSLPRPRRERLPNQTPCQGTNRKSQGDFEAPQLWGHILPKERNVIGVCEREGVAEERPELLLEKSQMKYKVLN